METHTERETTRQRFDVHSSTPPEEFEVDSEGFFEDNEGAGLLGDDNDPEDDISHACSRRSQRNANGQRQRSRLQAPVCKEWHSNR